MPHSLMPRASAAFAERSMRALVVGPAIGDHDIDRPAVLQVGHSRPRLERQPAMSSGHGAVVEPDAAGGAAAPPSPPIPGSHTALPDHGVALFVILFFRVRRGRLDRRGLRRRCRLGACTGISECAQQHQHSRGDARCSTGKPVQNHGRSGAPSLLSAQLLKQGRLADNEKVVADEWLSPLITSRIGNLLQVILLFIREYR